jgi:hypothetical protein
MSHRQGVTRLAIPSLWLLRLKLYVGATRDFLHLTSASTPVSTPATTSLRAFTSLNCLYCRLRVLSSLFDLCIPVFVRRGYTLIVPDPLTYCRPQDRRITYEIAIV